MNKKPAIFLCGHGSRNCEALKEFHTLVARLRDRLPDRQIGYGFLEFAEPTIDQGLENLRAQGAQEIHAVALTLFEGKHAAKDIPALLRDFGASHPDLRLHYGGGLGSSLHGDKILAIIDDRICDAEAGAKPIKRAESFLLLVARGTATERAGEIYQKMAACLQESHGFMGAVAAFSGLTKPSVAAGLEIAQQTGATRILVVPCFLFTGKLLKNLHKTVLTAAENTQTVGAPPTGTQTEFLVAAHFFGHPLLESALMERILERQTLEKPSGCARA